MLYPAIGFFGGFALGLIVVRLALYGVSKEELRTNKDLHKKYGTFVWLFAIFGTILGFIIKEYFF